MAEKSMSRLVMGLVLLCLFAVSNSCGRNGFDSKKSLVSKPLPQDPLKPVDPTPPISGMEPLLWDGIQIHGKDWSQYLFKVIKNETRTIFETAEDMTYFCPAFHQLNERQQINAIGMLVAAMAKFESQFNPLSRMIEPSLGIDPVTGLQVVSEGLLQLSYQDKLRYPFCNFDWQRDKGLSQLDPARSILNPYLNLGCGVRILADQILRRGLIVIENGAYWAVLRKNGKFEKIKSIASLVQSLSFCHK